MDCCRPRRSHCGLARRSNCGLSRRRNNCGGGRGRGRAFFNPCARPVYIPSAGEGRHTHSQSFSSDSVHNTHTHDHYHQTDIYNHETVNVHLSELNRYSQSENYINEGSSWICEDQGGCGRGGYGGGYNGGSSYGYGGRSSYGGGYDSGCGGCW